MESFNFRHMFRPILSILFGGVERGFQFLASVGRMETGIGSVRSKRRKSPVGIATCRSPGLALILPLYTSKRRKSPVGIAT